MSWVLLAKCRTLSELVEGQGVRGAFGDTCFTGEGLAGSVRVARMRKAGELDVKECRSAVPAVRSSWAVRLSRLGRRLKVGESVCAQLGEALRHATRRAPGEQSELGPPQPFWL